MLFHEAWLRLVGSDVDIQWKGRGHFFGAAAKVMQRILVENARRKSRLKAGGEYQRVELSKVTASGFQTVPFGPCLAMTGTVARSLVWD